MALSSSAQCVFLHSFRTLLLLSMKSIMLQQRSVAGEISVSRQGFTMALCCVIVRHDALAELARIYCCARTCPARTQAHHELARANIITKGVHLI